MKLFLQKKTFLCKKRCVTAPLLLLFIIFNLNITLICQFCVENKKL